MEMSFAKVFLPIYDRKIEQGEITFSTLGMSKSDFTRMCVDDSFVPETEVIIGLIEKLDLTAEEEINLRKFIL